MKYLSRIIVCLTIAITFMVSCKKEAALPFYNTGNAPVLSGSKATIAAAPADSSATVVTVSWTDPMYATNASTVKYLLEIDSTGRNFAKAVSFTVTGTTSKSFTGKELNDILLGFGFNFNVAYGIDLRITSSYANNNDTKVSNTLKLTATAYKVPPKIALPTSNRLFIVGGASTFGWSNSSTINPAEEFARLDETTWAGVFYFAGGDEYLILPVKGDWSHKFSLQNKYLSGVSAGGDFGFDLNDNFPAPSTGGWYKITMDFQRGKFTVEPFTGPQLPTDLFMVGDATPAQWNNPATGSSVQQLTRMNSCVWEMPTINITGGKEYLVLPVAGSWANKYSVADKTVVGLSAGGTFGYNLNDNFPGPAVGGDYKIELNFATAKFKTTKL
ncbi:MAG: SusE domain-containing protein [Chitinophagaceae bacterium]